MMTLVSDFQNSNMCTLLTRLLRPPGSGLIALLTNRLNSNYPGLAVMTSSYASSYATVLAGGALPIKLPTISPCLPVVELNIDTYISPSTRLFDTRYVKPLGWGLMGALPYQPQLIILHSLT